MTSASPAVQSAAKWWKGFLLAAWRALHALAQSGLLVPTVGALALGLLFLAWSCERQARMRQTLESEQVRARAQQDAAQLEARAAANLREARSQHEAAMRDYESRRARLESEAAGLRERLTSLRRQEAAQVAEVAALRLPQVVDRVMARLGEEGIRDQGLGISETAGTRDSGLALREKEHAQFPSLRPPAPNTGGTPVLRGPESPVKNSESRVPSPVVLGLTEPAARAVETAFVELEACRTQSAAKDAELENCRALAQVDQSAIAQQDITLGKLNAALADKDQILARREEAHQAELKLARGTRWSRFLSALKYVAAGVVAGVVIR